MIRYNWDAVREHTSSNVTKILDFFINVYVTKAENFMALNPYAAKIIADDRSKQSFIVNIKELVLNRGNATDSEVLMYLDLASRRNFFTYINTGKKVDYLPTWKIAGEYDTKKLERNRLLLIKDNNIHFIYENGD